MESILVQDNGGKSYVLQHELNVYVACFERDRQSEAMSDTKCLQVINDAILKEETSASPNQNNIKILLRMQDMWYRMNPPLASLAEEEKKAEEKKIAEEPKSVQQVLNDSVKAGVEQLREETEIKKIEIPETSRLEEMRKKLLEMTKKTKEELFPNK